MNLQKVIAAPIALGLTLGSFPVFNSPAHAKSIDVPIPKAVVATGFNAAFNSMKVRVDNYGKKQGTSWLQNSSYILLPNGVKKSFAIPEYTFNVTKTRKLKYYVDDFNTSSIKATVNGNRIQATAYFESQGEEVKAKCIRRRLKKWGECKLKMERDIHLNNSRISTSLIPVAYKGSISYASPKVDFKTDVRIPNRLCKAFKGICKHIEGRINKELTNTIESNLSSGLSSTAVRSKVASTVRNSLNKTYLKKYKGWKVVKIYSKGNNFVVRLSK
ncbi:MAG: hypothetical protein AAF378_05490 [Cyanobacteria bacterium P01_A01_bin.84]